MGILQTVIAALVIACLPAAAWAQRVTKYQTATPSSSTAWAGFISWASGAPTSPHCIWARRVRRRSHVKTRARRRRRLSAAASASRAIVHRVIFCGSWHSARPYASNTTRSRDRAPIAARTLFLEDGTLLNAEMLKAGRARLDPTRQFVREKEFKRLEEEAQSASVGIWMR